MFKDILLKTNLNSKYNPKINDNVTTESFDLKWKIQCFYDKTIFQGNNNVYFSINSFKRIHCNYVLINDMLVLSLKHFLFLCISKYIKIRNHSIISHPNPSLRSHPRIRNVCNNVLASNSRPLLT